MSEDAYARHIIQKHRVAVAIAVIKNKPPNLSIDAYLQQVRDKITASMNDDDDTSCSGIICSEDFYTFDEENTSNFDTLPIKYDIINVEMQNNVIDTSNFDTVANNTEKNNRQAADISKGISKSNTNTNIDEDVNIMVLNNRVERDNDKILRDVEKEQTVFDINKEKDKCISTTTQFQLMIDQFQHKTKATEQELESLNRTMTVNEDETDKEDLDDSMNILKGIQVIGEKVDGSNVLENEVLTEVFNLIRNADLDIEKEINSQRTYCGSQTEEHPDSQKTTLYTVDTLPSTYYSQSQTQNINIQRHFIKNNERSQSSNLDSVAITNITNSNNLNDVENMEIENNSTKDMQNTNVISSVISTGHINDERRNENEVFSEEELSTSQAGLPFKIIEEMNKIKSLLNKRNRRVSTDGHSTDSGYRSDSQKSSRNSLHLSQNWLNQSGCSLLRHLIQCSLTNSNQEINNEISQVLGELVDSLHSEERYPTLLEEILENVDRILRDLHEEENDGESPLQKEEYLNRLILLNKSRHIQKYTISKITSILEVLFTELSQSEIIYELYNIDKFENLTYIFHLLTIIVKIHLKTQQTHSQSADTQLTDSKRSSIVEVWRKKWKLSTEAIDPSNKRENDCVLSKCREALNKIVVGCIEKYSLISYLALECFNLLQN